MLKFKQKVKYVFSLLLINFNLKESLFYIIPFFNLYFIINKLNGKIKKITFDKSSNDKTTFKQVFYDNEYLFSNLGRFNELKNRYNQILINGNIPLIIDCGSNVGYSAYFLNSLFTKSFVLGFEPDTKNFIKSKLFESDNIFFFNTAISACGSDLNLSGSLNNAYQTEKISFNSVEENVNKVRSTTINNILKEYDSSIYTPFIIKIDIEGFEKELFSTNYEWVNEFSSIAIELHDWLFTGKATSKDFFKVISEFDFDFIQKNSEIIFCINNKNYLEH